MEALTPLPQIVAKRQDIAQVKPGAVKEGVFDIFNYLGSFFFAQEPKQLYNKATHLHTAATVETFVQYIGNLQVELNEASALTPDRVEVRTDCMRRLSAMGVMEDHAREWMKEHSTYEFEAVTLTFQQVKALRKRVMDAVPNVGGYTVPDAPPLDPSSSISKVSPGITNGGNNCYLISLLQGIIGDPITRQWIIEAEFLYDSPLLEDSERKIRNFVRVLKECTFEFEEAQRLGRKDPLPFIIKLRTALDPIVTSINLSRGGQEDPSEILVALLSYLNPEGNPLFNVVTEKLVFDVKQEAGEKLNDGARKLAAFSVQIATLKNQTADESEVKAGLMDYLNYLHPTGDYAKFAGDIPEILKAILLKLNERTEESFSNTRSKELHETKIAEIVSEESRPKLIAKVEELIANLQSMPAQVDTEWTKAKPTAREGLRTLKVNGHTQSNAFESFIDAAFHEKFTADKTGALSSVQYLDKTPDEVRLEVTHSKYAFQTTPQQVFFALNRNAHSGNRSNSGSFKEIKKVHLGETFFLHPKFTEDKKGGQYQVRWCCVHQGGGDESGHYVNYRLTEKGWFCLDDGRSTPADAKTVETALQNCCLIFASRMDQDLSESEIQTEIEAAIEASHGKDNEQRYTDIERSQSSEAKEFSLLHLFSSELSREVPKLELLKTIFAALEETEFPGFVRDMLTLTQHPEQPPIKDQLLQLKEIRNQWFMPGLDDHIVAQYVAVRERRRQHTLDTIALKEITEDSLRAAEERAKKIHTALTYENTCIEYLLAQKNLKEGSSLFLLRTLSPALNKKYEALMKSSEKKPSIFGCLEELSRRNLPHIESSEQLLETIRKLDYEITVKANKLINAVKTGAPVRQPRREVRKERKRAKTPPPTRKRETLTSPKVVGRERRNSLPLSFC
ncbi:hypothetical protein [Candidatus Neptunichlamydia sp. REUL1]|uniref:hypothetical protein n=1 Tax=Candidatus Neptunichlamydia sp. REUL1 TaxID=3064277 RepID=UPI0029314A15|nr:hypothetical protein [Candidatus Neptunochlamydia sp. REUL1]